MNNNREYTKFLNHLAKKYFPLNEARKLLESEFVKNVTEVGPDPAEKNYIKYLVTLVEDEVYTVYATT